MRTYYARYDHEDRQVECLSSQPEYEAEHRSIYYETIRAESIEDARRKASELFSKEIAEARLFNVAPELLDVCQKAFDVTLEMLQHYEDGEILALNHEEAVEQLHEMASKALDKAKKGTP